MRNASASASALWTSNGDGLDEEPDGCVFLPARSEANRLSSHRPHSKDAPPLQCSRRDLGGDIDGGGRLERAERARGPRGGEKSTVAEIFAETDRGDSRRRTRAATDGLPRNSGRSAMRETTFFRRSALSDLSDEDGGVGGWGMGDGDDGLGGC